MNAVPDNLTNPPATPRRRAKEKVVSIAEKQKPEKIRAELNIEKWPGIWQPAKAHTRLARRTLERNVELKDRGVAVSKLIIGFTDLGTLTTEDQKMFYALIRQWEEAGKPFGKPVYFSDRLLSRLLKKRGWGTNVIEAITSSLRRLRLTPLRWIKSFHKNDEVGREYEEEIPFQMLDDLKIITRRAHGHITNQQGYFQFNKYIEANLLANYTKPLLDEVFFQIEGEIAQLLYTHIDLVMFGKTRYERCTKELFTDLGLLIPENASYRYKSNRKQKLERALRELRGIRLNHGILKSATIEETKDGADYKAVFIKGSRPELEQEPTDAPASAEIGDVVVNHYARIKDTLHLQAEELVQHFHKIFHGVEVHDPQSKETGQALSLISQYGLDTSKWIVDFAHAEAAKTNYQMQHFGGVLNYASRALAALDLQRKQEEKSKVVLAEQTRRLEQEQQKYERGERRLAALTAEQYQARFEKAKAELYAEYPKLAQFIRGREDSKIHEGSIRGRMIRQLDQEDMDLLPIAQPLVEPQA